MLKNKRSLSSIELDLVTLKEFVISNALATVALDRMAIPNIESLNIQNIETSKHLKIDDYLHLSKLVLANTSM